MALRLLFFVVLLVLLAAGCAPPLSGPDRSAPRVERSVGDLADLPQDPRAWLDPDWADRPVMSAQARADSEAAYRRAYFGPWDRDGAKFLAEQVFWFETRYGAVRGWGENLKPLPADHVSGLVALADRPGYPSRPARKAISVKACSLRALPTDRPFFEDPSKAGEGFPFDYLQNTSIHPFTPLLVTHASRDGAWLLVEAPFAVGFVRPECLAYVDEVWAHRLRKSAFATPQADGVPVRDGAGRTLALVDMGTLVPVVGDGSSIPVRGADERAVFTAGPAEGLSPWPLPPTPRTAAELGSRMSGKPYGWGGLFGARDCSSLTRDLMTAVGIWLERNSGDQALAGTVVDLADLPPKEKERRIIERGVPFFSLLSMKGHVMLYIGERAGRPVAFHAVWGVRTREADGRDGRIVIGKAAVTTLTPGAEHPESRGPGLDLLSKTRALNVLVSGSGGR